MNNNKQRPPYRTKKWFGRVAWDCVPREELVSLTPGQPGRRSPCLSPPQTKSIVPRRATLGPWRTRQTAPKQPGRFILPISRLRRIGRPDIYLTVLDPSRVQATPTAQSTHSQPGRLTGMNGPNTPSRPPSQPAATQTLCPAASVVFVSPSNADTRWHFNGESQCVNLSVTEADAYRLR